MIEVGHIRTPLGVLIIRVEKARIFGTSFTTQDRGHAIIPNVEKHFRDYFSGRLHKFNLPIVLTGTAFQKAVWRAVRRIPYGQTASYAQIARRIGKPKAVRAVANAIGANKLAIIVPCHRVVRSDGEVGGYAWGQAKKAKLLALEKRYRPKA